MLRAADLLDAVAMVPIDRALLLAAGGALTQPPPSGRWTQSHVVAAVDISPIDAFVTYDERQAAAARLVGLRTMAPGA